MLNHKYILTVLALETLGTVELCPLQPEKLGKRTGCSCQETLETDIKLLGEAGDKRTVMSVLATCQNYN